MALMALLFTGLFTTHANARGHAVDGLYIEMAGGGDSAGYMVSDERGRYGRDHYRHGYRSNMICREIVEVIRGRHGRYREVVRTICRERDDWHRPHHRRDYSENRYRGNDRW